MNKKITVMELLNKIANGEELPKKIKINSKVYNFCGTCKIYEDEYERDLVIKWNGLNDYVEILEDNTEEIEEYKLENFEQLGYEVGKLYLDFAKGIAKAINSIRKDKNND